MDDFSVSPIREFIPVETGRPDDFFITAASWEGRCLGLPQKLNTYKANSCIVFAYSSPNKLRELHLKELQRLISPVVGALHLIRSKHEEVLHSAYEFLPILKAAATNQPLKISWDVSCLTKKHLLVLLESLRCSSLSAEIRFLHTESADYPLDNTTGRSRGLSSPRTIDLFRGNFFPSRDTLLVVFLGYEGHRSYSMWQHLEPNQTILVVPRPAYRAGWDGRTERQNTLLLSSVSPECVSSSHSLIASDTTDFLERTLVKTGKIAKYNISIAPLGTKAQTLGLYSFVRKFPGLVNIVYASPILYEIGEIFVAAGETWEVDRMVF